MDALARSAQRIDRSIATLRAEVAAPPKPPPPAALAKLDARVGALRNPVNALRDATNDTSTVDQLHNLQRAHLATEGLLTDAKLRLRCFGVSAAPPAASATAPVEAAPVSDSPVALARTALAPAGAARAPASSATSDVPASPGFDIDLDCARYDRYKQLGAKKAAAAAPAAPAEPLISFGSPTPSAPPAAATATQAPLSPVLVGAATPVMALDRPNWLQGGAAAPPPPPPPPPGCMSAPIMCQPPPPPPPAQDGNFFPQASALSEEELAAAPAYLLQQLGMESVAAVNAKLTAVNERVAERALFEDDPSGVVGLDDLRALLRVDPARTRTFALLMMHCDRFAAGAEQGSWVLLRK